MIDYIKQSPQTYTSFLVWKHDQTCLVYVIYKYSSWLVLYFNWLLIISMESCEKDIALVIKLLHAYECATLKWPFLTVYLVDESIMCTYHCDVIMSAMASQITSIWVFTRPFIQAQIKENIKALRHWPLWGEFTGDRWIPHTKSQKRGNNIIVSFDGLLIASCFENKKMFIRINHK